MGSEIKEHCETADSGLVNSSGFRQAFEGANEEGLKSREGCLEETGEYEMAETEGDSK